MSALEKVLFGPIPQWERKLKEGSLAVEYFPRGQWLPHPNIHDNPSCNPHTLAKEASNIACTYIVVEHTIGMWKLHF